MSKNYIVDLSKYKNEKAKFIVGRENGYNAKEKEQLDKLVNEIQNGEDSKIEFHIAEDIYGVVSSFILGMLSEIVVKINNKERIYEIFSFDKLPSEIQKEFIEEIDYILGDY